MIKINLVREGRAVRGAGAPAAAAAAAGVPGGRNINNALMGLLALVGVVLAGGYWFIKKNTLSERRETAAARQAEADKLAKIIKEVEEFQSHKESLQKRIDLINQLKTNQKGPVRIMDRISQDLPDLVWLDKFQLTGGKIILSGRSLNANSIANFTENIKNDPYFEEPQVGTISQASVQPLVYSFDMEFGFTYTPKDATAATGTDGATTTSGTAGTTGTAAPGGTR